MTRPDLDAIRARCEAAAPGPWVRDELEIRSFVRGRCQMVIYDEGGHDEQDAEFIAHARTDIPALLVYIDGLERELAEARAEAASSLAMARIADEKHGWKCAEIDMLRGVGCMEDGDGPCGVCRKCAYRRGAEAMREACLGVVERFMDFGSPHPGMIAHKISALPTPEEGM